LTIDTILPVQRIRRRVGGVASSRPTSFDGLLDNLDEVSYRQALGSRYRRWLSAVVSVNLRGMGEQRHFVRRAESLQR
jgi:hypothetical protein